MMYRQLLTKDIRLLLGTVCLISVSLFGCYGVLLNLFLLRLDYDATFIGLINGVGLLSWAIAAPLAGLAVNRTGHRNLMLIGLSTILLGSILLPSASMSEGSTRSIWLIGSYAITFTGLGVFFVNMYPFFMAAVAPNLRSRMFALSHAVFPIAGFAGSLVGGFLPDLLSNLPGLTHDSPTAYRYSLQLAALPLVPTLFLIGAITNVEPVRPSTQSGHFTKAPLIVISVMTLLGLLRPFGEGSIRTFFNVYMDAGLDVATAPIGVAFAISQLVAAPMALATPYISRHIGAGKTALIASAGITVVLVPFALIATPTAAICGLIMIALCASILQPSIGIYTMELVKPRFWSLMSGFMNAAWALGMGTTAFAGGIIIDSHGYQALFITMASISALSIIILMCFIAKYRAAE